jgi:hypothetical protein
MSSLVITTPLPTKLPLKLRQIITNAVSLATTGRILCRELTDPLPLKGRAYRQQASGVYRQQVSIGSLSHANLAGRINAGWEARIDRAREVHISFEGSYKLEFVNDCLIIEILGFKEVGMELYSFYKLEMRVIPPPSV